LQMPKLAQRLSRWSNRRVKFSSKARKPFWTKRIVQNCGVLWQMTGIYTFSYVSLDWW
jgi:hypothetical protein